MQGETTPEPVLVYDDSVAPTADGFQALSGDPENRDIEHPVAPGTPVRARGRSQPDGAATAAWVTSVNGNRISGYLYRILPAERQMSFAEYLALPMEIPAEYADGVATAIPPLEQAQQKVIHRLMNLLTEAAPQLPVVTAAGLRLPECERVRIPDVMVLRAEATGPVIHDVPLLVVEVLPSARPENLVPKAGEYQAAGVANFWVVDPQARVLDLYRNTPGGWEVVAHLSEEQSAVSLCLDEAAAVEVSVAAVFD